MKFDEVLKEIGEFGTYQKLVFFLTALPSLLGAFEAVSVVFTFNIPKHRCAIPGLHNDTYSIGTMGSNSSLSALVRHYIPVDPDDGELDKCRIYSDVFLAASDDFATFLSGGGYDVIAEGQNGTNTTVREGAVNVTRKLVSCNRWVYDHSVFDTTIATDFDVVCDRSVQRASSNFIGEWGCLFGTLICGLAADRFGRKTPFYIGGIALVAGGFGIAFTTNLITFNICRFLLGMARLGLWVNGMVIGMEIVGPSRRVFVGVVMTLAWCAGMFLLLIFAYVIRNWRYLEIGLSVPSLVLLVYWWVIPESPRWLVSQGREKEAMQVLERIAKSNKTVVPKIDDVKGLLESEKTLGFCHIFKSRELIVRMLIVFSNMFVLCIIYYALIFNITNLAGDIFINYLISVVLETAGYTVPYWLLDRLGRKPVYCGSVLLAGAACVLCLVPDLLQAPDWVLVSLSMVGRFFVCIGYGVIYIYATELFPTVIRGSAVGVGVTFSRIGGFISPFLADVGILVGGRFEKALPLLIMGSPALLVGVIALWLPETKGINLPENLNDVNDIQSKRGCFCCKTRSEKHSREREAIGDEDICVRLTGIADPNKRADFESV